MAHVQKIEFILKPEQLETIFRDITGQNKAIRIVLGVNENAELVLEAFGTEWPMTKSNTSSGGSGSRPCPVPPDCPKS